MSLPTEPRKTKPRGRHPQNALSPDFVREVDRAGRYCDGNGLYLDVQPSGSRSWVQRITIEGRRREMGLGGYPMTSLDEARARAFTNRKVARGGGDPVTERRRFADTPTVAAAAEEVWAQIRSGWRSRRYTHDWMSGLKRLVFPYLGELRVSKVTRAHVLDVLRPLWHSQPTTARRLLQRIDAVMEWAVAMDYRGDNPCNRIARLLGRQREKTRHMPALPHREVAAAVEKVRRSDRRPVVKLAFEFLVLTAARSGEVRGARWPEVDRAARVWTVPAERMKTNREQRVPLCRRAVEILDEAQAFGNGGGLVFPGARGRLLKDMSLSDPLRELAIDAVPHGFRSSFRDWASEETNHPREVVEAALAHQVRNRVEAAYARSDLFARRRRLMDDWAEYLANRAGESAPDVQL